LLTGAVADLTHLHVVELTSVFDLCRWRQNAVLGAVKLVNVLQHEGATTASSNPAGGGVPAHRRPSAQLGLICSTHSSVTVAAGTAARGWGPS
jgi:hypothetical protein